MTCIRFVWRYSLYKGRFVDACLNYYSSYQVAFKNLTPQVYDEVRTFFANSLIFRVSLHCNCTHLNHFAFDDLKFSWRLLADKHTLYIFHIYRKVFDRTRSQHTLSLCLAANSRHNWLNELGANIWRMSWNSLCEIE